MFHPPKSVEIAAALVLAAGIGALEYVAGRDFHLSAFFLVPVAWAGWTAGRRAGLWLAGVCTLIRLAADLSSYHHSARPLIPYWDALMLFAFFVAIVYSLSAFQEAHRKLVAARLELEQQNERLEQTVRQRTGALEAEIAQRKRLETAKIQAERLAMVGTIAAQVAHEVRNPLGSITLNLDLIAKEIERYAAEGGQAVQESRVLVTEMRQEVRRIQRVTEEYLKFARLPRFQPQSVELNNFLEQKFAFMTPAFQKANVGLRTEFDPELKTVKADGEQLWQAILNLVQNALEAMPGGGTLVVCTRRESNHILVRVSDTGKGMTEEQLKQIFVPFFTTKPRGTGLGLALTQQILNEHGAQLDCASVVGRGSTFTIIFPLAPAS
jgi:signal transduction histidine kinase